MIGFMLLFASAMSLVINFADRKLSAKEEVVADTVQPDERTQSTTPAQ
jgi:hypothetical protein